MTINYPKFITSIDIMSQSVTDPLILWVIHHIQHTYEKKTSRLLVLAEQQLTFGPDSIYVHVLTKTVGSIIT